LIFNGSLGIRNNNLLKDQLNTTINRIGSAFINFNPRPHYGFNLNYTNYGTELNSGQRQLNDSIMFSIINQSIGGGFRYAKTKGGRTISFALNAQTQNLQDNNILTRANTESSTMVLSTSLNIGNGKIGTNGGATLNYTKVNTRLGTFQLVGPSINVRKSFRKTKLNLSANASFQQKIKENKSDGNITNIGLTTNYTLKKKHNFSLMLNALFNRTTNISIYTFNEQRLSAQYTFTL
jgi:hypothetical protein